MQEQLKALPISEIYPNPFQPRIEFSDEELAEKSADSINMNRSDLSARHKQILTNMDIGVEYSTEQIAEKIGLKGPRTRQLLNELVNKELLACVGTTKRRYIKTVD